MKKTPQPRPVRAVHVFVDTPDGCQTLGSLHLADNVGLYSTRDIEQALVHERQQWVNYMLSVLEVLRK